MRIWITVAPKYSSRNCVGCYDYLGNWIDLRSADTVRLKAGDFKDSADKTKIMILRNGGDRVHSELVNLTDINSLKTANLMIKPNDIVYVLPNNMKIFNKKVSDVSPIVRLIGSLLSPFITLKILSN